MSTGLIRTDEGGSRIVENPKEMSKVPWIFV